MCQSRWSQGRRASFKEDRPFPTAIPSPPRGTVSWARHEAPSAYSRSSPQGFDAALPTRGRTTTREPEEGISFTEDFPEGPTTRATSTLPWRGSERGEKELWRGPTPLQPMQVLHSPDGAWTHSQRNAKVKLRADQGKSFLESNTFNSELFKPINTIVKSDSSQNNSVQLNSTSDKSGSSKGDSLRETN